MAELLTSPYFLAAVFFFVALVYSSVGLGGGSTYTALMTILGFSPTAIPLISLSLNLVVTAVGSVNFVRHGHARLKLVLPFLLTSIPMAYLGGALQVPKLLFYWLLLVSLVFVAVRIYLWRDISLRLQLGPSQKMLISLLAGSLLGLIAGIVGIGGGIYLVPLIIVLGLGSEKEAAACGAIFIFLNSLAGVVARLQFNAVSLMDYLPLIIAVFLGGLVGSLIGSTKLSARAMDRILGIIVLVAIAFLLKQLLFS